MNELVNISGGNLHLESLGIHLIPGARLPFDGDLDDFLIRAPEIALYLERGRAAVEQMEQSGELNEHP